MSINLALVVAMVAGMAGLCAAQDKIQFKPCEDAMNPLASAVNKFNVGRKDGLRMELQCIYTNPEPPKPKRTVHVSAAEARELNRLRQASTLAFTLQSKYEDYLILRHHLKKPEFGDPCWYFVGFVLDEDYITIDQNTGYGGCK